jgi:phosphoribosyl 1,2-cyclic phosphodiesterase
MSKQSSTTIRFWGVRGCIAGQCAYGVRYGGNTSCVSIDLGPDKVLVLDAGTGIRQLGKALADTSADIFVLLSHGHTDHIQGFPFFLPIYQPNRRIYVFPTLEGKSMICSLLEQMDGAHLPVTPDDLPSQWECITEEPMGFMRDHGFHISRISTNHPGGGYGYRIENHGRSVVYLTDNELDPPGQKATQFDGFVQFCRRTDVLIHDAQYLEKDMPHKHGWGHSLVSQACELATAAEARHLILYHHDPDRTDDELDVVQQDARAWFTEKNANIRCTVASEGLTLDI